ncbi:YbgA family protein [Alloiococcus sp. CFN-8]|uniref:YbgA family protein n=1 Tax=Alloiococcus sp. CFN-8 TaxID=3416081 RepID=UPI003CEBAD3F
MDFRDRPIIIISKCLGFEPCRYNGQMVRCPFIEKLAPYVHIEVVCPEVGIGLPTPRKPIRLVNSPEGIRVYEPSANNDYTYKMSDFIKEYINNITSVDGFILKSRSPSCGVKDVRIYEGKDKSASARAGKGIFASELSKKYKDIPIEDEGRLSNLRIREHFLTRLFTLHSFKKVMKEESLTELLKFHQKNKFLIKAYNQGEYRSLEAIIRVAVSNHSLFVEERLRNPLSEPKAIEAAEEYKKVAEMYSIHLKKAFSRMPRYTNYINVFLEIYKSFEKDISKEEREFILKTIEKFKTGRLPSLVPLNVLRAYVIKFNNKAMINQSIWEPYPEELMDLSDSGK